MAQIQVEIDGKIITGPSENIPILLKRRPDAKILGPVEESPYQKAKQSYLGAIKEVEKLPFSPLTMPIKAGAFLAPRSEIELGAQLAAGPAAKYLVKPLGKLAIQKVGPAVASTLSGASREALEVVSKKVASPLKKHLLDPITANKILQEAKDNLIAKRRELGQKVGNIVDAIHRKLGGQSVIQTSDIAEKLTKKATDSFGEISPGVSNVVKKLKVRGPVGILESSSSKAGTLTYKQAFDLKEEISEMLHPFQADITGQQLGAIRSKDQKFLTEALKELDKRMVALAPRFGAANKAFSELASAMSFAAKKVLGKEDPQAAATAILKKGGRSRFLLEQIDKKLPKTAKFLDKVEDLFVTEELSKPIGQFARTGLTAGLGGLTTLAAGRSPEEGFGTAAGILAASSPYLQGRLLRGAGVAGRIAAPFTEEAIRTAIPATRKLFGEK